MNIYFLSGLGADERVFKNLCLPSGFNIVHIPWQLVKGDESISTYARNLSNSIDNTAPFMLAGLSFGGLVAAEISKFMQPEKLILFSTVRTKYQLPLLYRFAGKLKLNKVLPATLLPFIRPFLLWFFGPLDKGSKDLVEDYLKHTDPVMLRWALGQISNWENTVEFSRFIHIHGMQDKALPCRLSHPSYIIETGGHFCVFTHATEVNKILEKELSHYLS